MTLHRRNLAAIPAATAAVGQKLLPPTNPYRVIGDHLADILDDAPFADLYESTARAAISPSLLALVTVFQFRENIPDRAAAEQVVVRLDWTYALHLPLDDAGFDFSCLCYFRRRLLAHGQERLVCEEILRKVQARGFIKTRGKQRTDSLAVLGAVRQLSALETVSETLRLAVRALAQAAPDWVARALPATFVAEYAARHADYRLSAAERTAALQQVGQDGVWLLERLDATAPVALRELEAVPVLRAVGDQRYERVEGRTRVREKLVACTALIVTPHDPGVRAGEKRGTKWRGDKVHVTETAEAEAPHFVTAVTTASAPSVDSAALPLIRQRLAERALPPGEQSVDAGYVSGPHLAQSQDAGSDLVGPALPDTTPTQLKIAAFTLDRATKRALCPQGHASLKWGVSTEPDGSQSVHIQFAAAVCAACPLRPQCTTGKSGRSLRLSEHSELVAARRAEAQTEEFRARLRARPALEATLSALVRKHGLRRPRYRGEAKRAFENLLKGAACNLKRLARALVARWERDAAASALAVGRGSRVTAQPLAA